MGHSPTPIDELLRAGIKVAIGSDSVAVTGRFDLLGEAAHQTPVDLGATTSGISFLELAAEGGAMALGLHGASQLAPGQLADLVIIAPMMEPYPAEVNTVAQWIGGGRQIEVRDVMVGGRLLMRRRELMKIDEGRAIAEARAWGRAWGARLDLRNQSL